MLEKDLFPPLKKYFKELGYKVFPEVPAHYSGMGSVDFVAVKGEEQIAVEMKLHFNWKVISQAHYNKNDFGKSYVAFPVNKAKIFGSTDKIFAPTKKDYVKYNHCLKEGIGILEVLPSGIIFEASEGLYSKPYKPYSFAEFIEKDDDEAGLPYQKGVSAGYYELKEIENYVRSHPDAKWKEIYDNVSNHYSNHKSMAGAMAQWRGFNLAAFKKIVAENKYIPRNHNG
jgi:Holliday junction resolvase